MTKLLKVMLGLAGALVALAGAAAAQEETTGSAVETMPQTGRLFDGRAWSQGYAVSTPEMEITEYVLPGEVVEAWTELVTVQRMPGLGNRAQPLELMTVVRKETLKHCRSTTWTVLRQEKDEVLYQWGHQGCRKFDDVFEVAKLYREGSSIVRVAWATKKLPVTEETRATWIKVIGDYR